MSLARVVTFLKSLQGFSLTADVYRLPVASRFVKFLRLFGYEIEGSGPNMIVKRPSNPTPGAVIGRPAGAVDILPRNPRRNLPANLEIIINPDNPHRRGTGAYTRYENYKNATTIGELRNLGATPQDIREILEKGFGVLQ